MAKKSRAEKLASNFDKPLTFCNIVAGGILEAVWGALKALWNAFFKKGS